MREIKIKVKKSNRIRFFIIATIAVAGLVLFPGSVQARKLLHIHTIPSEKVINQDVFLFGQQPTIEGVVNGDVFILGREAAILGEVNGSVFVLADKLDLAGTVNGNLYSAAVEISQSADGRIDRNFYAFVLSLMTESESTIGRDLNLVAMSARLEGKTFGKTSALIGPWEIFKVLQEFFNQNVTGFTPSAPSIVKMETEPIFTRSGLPYMASIRIKEEDQEPSALGEWALAALKSLVNFIVVGSLVLWLLPQRFDGWVTKVKTEPLVSAGYGILVFINGYLIPIIVLVLVIGLFIGLLFLSLPSLGWVFFGLGMGFLIMIVTLFQVAITFISKAIVAYLLGSLILSKIFPGALKYTFLPLLLGLLIYVPLASIPYFGFVIGLAATLLGLGAIWLGRKNLFRQEKELNEMA